ncbi:SH3 domain-containing protein [Microbacterium sp. MYb66]|uniref:SH3 domain-containing protein n=1 Tax=Microbacterium sp. MYb66 TaxID=1848692 RepID=UPI0035BE1F2D
MRRSRILHDHPAPEPAPFIARAGDRVHVHVCGDAGDDPFELVTALAGKARIPTRYLSAERPDATVLFSYDTAQLPVKAGDIVTVIVDDPANGQSWCRDRRGGAGWVPHAAFGTTAEGPDTEQRSKNTK